MREPVHLHPTAPLAERVLLPGDPGRALLLAQVLLQEPKMFNHNRGLWGYSGAAPDGEALTIQSTGMGGPSAAIVVSELVELGARALLRVGTCGALDPSLSLGDLLIVTEAHARDGTSRALGAEDRVAPSDELLAALSAAANGAARRGPVVSTDLFYERGGGDRERLRATGALAVEMETATLLALAASLESVQAASALIVSDLLVPLRRRIAPEELRVAERRLGELAYRALAQV